MITNKDLTYSKYIELCSMLCGNLDGRGVWGRMYACICVAESLVVHLCLHIPPSLLHPLSSAFCTDPFHPCACAQWLSHVRLFVTPWTGPWDVSKQKYCSRLPFPSSEDLPHPGIKPVLLCQHWQRFLYHCATWEAPT